MIFNCYVEYLNTNTFQLPVKYSNTPNVPLITHENVNSRNHLLQKNLHYCLTRSKTQKKNGYLEKTEIKKRLFRKKIMI